MPRLSCTLAVVAVLGAAGPVFASRPTCDELLAARSSGQPAEHVAQALGTTRARVEACARIAEQRQRLAEGNARFHFKRAERGLEQ